MLELYIWGPAFSLPSFDPECIAAVAYLNLLLPQDQWSLVPAHDPTSSPSGDFPLLRDGSTSVAGLSAIIKFLSTQGYTLDSQLTPRQRADAIALSNHIATNAFPLISHHLHSSPQTYTATTLPAISSTLPPSVRYTLPSIIHANSLSRATAAGLSSTDDSDQANSQPAEAKPQPGSADHADAELASGIKAPSLLFKRKQTLQAALRDEQSKTRFRIEAAVDTLLEPIADKLFSLPGKRRNSYLLGARGDGLTSLDCLAFGYLSLLLYPAVKESFVTDTICKRYPLVVEYIEALRKDILGGTAPIDASVIMSSSSSPDRPTFFSLPWRHPSTPSNPHPSTTLSTLTTPLNHLILPSLQSRSLIPPSIHLKNNPFTTSNQTPPPLWLLTATFTLGPALLATLSYLLFQHAQNDWVGWGGGERHKQFIRQTPHAGADRDAGPHDGTGVGDVGLGGGDASDVLSALFGPPPTASLADAVEKGDEREFPAPGGWEEGEEGREAIAGVYDGRERQRRNQDGEVGIEVVEVEVGR